MELCGVVRITNPVGQHHRVCTEKDLVDGRLNLCHLVLLCPSGARPKCFPQGCLVPFVVLISGLLISAVISIQQPHGQVFCLASSLMMLWIAEVQKWRQSSR